MTDKTILYIDGTRDAESPKAIIKCFSQEFGYDFQERKYNSLEQLKKDIENFSEPIHILYLSAHGDKEGVQFDRPKDGTDKEFVSWPEIALMLCEAEGLSEDSTVYLSCCQSGFKRTALTLMAACDKIDTVCGLACNLEIRREALAFHAYLLHEELDSDATRTANAVNASINQQFNIFMRQEMDAEVSVFYHNCPEIWMTASDYKEYSQSAEEHAHKERNTNARLVSFLESQST